jgi:hypothetical protein
LCFFSDFQKTGQIAQSGHSDGKEKLLNLLEEIILLPVCLIPIHIKRDKQTK